MANEISITASLAASKGGASLASGTLSKSLDMTGVAMCAQTQAIGYAADEQLDLSPDIGTIGYIAIKNLDGANFVELSYDTGGSFPTYKFAEVPAGSAMLFKPAFPTGKTHIYAKADTADVLIQYWSVEA